MSTTLCFESGLAATPETVWAWITSFDSIAREMSPVLRMSAPKGVTHIASTSFEPGVRMFRCWVSLFGVIPIDFTDLTLLSLTPGVGFVEQSRMGSMRFWRHERRIYPLDSGCLITDTVTFEPKLGGKLVVGLVKRFFTHRHHMLRKYLGEIEAYHSLPGRDEAQ